MTVTPPIEIYTQPACPYCIRAIQLLRGKGVVFTEISAPPGSKERADSIQRAGGKTSVPQIFVGGKLIGGCDDLYALERAKRLDPVLFG